MKFLLAEEMLLSVTSDRENKIASAREMALTLVHHALDVLLHHKRSTQERRKRACPLISLSTPARLSMR